MRTTGCIAVGDCVEVMRAMPVASVDLVFADPPFNIGYRYDRYKDNLSGTDYVKWSAEWIGAASGILKPYGAMWVAIGDEWAAELCSLLKGAGLYMRNWVVWYYTFGVHCTTKFTRSHAHLLYFTKDRKYFTFNVDAIRVPSARQTKYKDKRANADGRVPDDTWEYPRVCGTHKERQGFHGCQMPEALLGRIIRACSNEGDRVFDPFVGSGTTLAVAKKLGRRYRGAELSANYAEQAHARVEGVAVGDTLCGEQPTGLLD